MGGGQSNKRNEGGMAEEAIRVFLVNCGCGQEEPGMIMCVVTRSDP